jgi:hypothetical protein
MSRITPKGNGNASPLESGAKYGLLFGIYNTIEKKK